MSRWKVYDVMTAEVVSVRPDASFHVIADILTSRGVSAVPVIDPDSRVLGVVSEADLLAKIEFAGEGSDRHTFEGRGRRTARRRSAATIAGELMTAPAVTIRDTASIVEAAKLLDSAGVKRLPVVDTSDRLVGIVSRHDLLSVFRRSDKEIRTEIVDEILTTLLSVDPAGVRVEVAGGQVTLTGELDRKSLVPLAVRLVEKVDGVVRVDNRLGYRRDDTAEPAPDRMTFLHRP
ncbi:MAG TPA: CBS domain-containing protein [Pilimelia sp.]|nr:CBS domain-containing protein [Pilimelia sp.]